MNLQAKEPFGYCKLICVCVCVCVWGTKFMDNQTYRDFKMSPDQGDKNTNANILVFFMSQEKHIKYESTTS